MAAGLVDEVRRAGGLTFARFMSLALYGEDGYYNRCVRIGEEGGDFYTASGMPLFAHTLALWAERNWRRWRRPRYLQVVEIGPGQGEFAQTFLSAWRARMSDACELRYVLLERAPGLQRLQYERLRSCPETVWDDILPDWPTLVVGNEVLDALPVERVRRRRDGWDQAWVVWDEDRNGLALSWRPTDGPVADLAYRYVDCPVDCQAEVAVSLTEFFDRLRRMAALLSAVFFDYGITREEWQAGVRPHGTLRGYRGHRVRDLDAILACPGGMDVTADVNWTQVLATAAESGFTALPLRSQGQFLLNEGILQAAETLAATAAWPNVAAQVKRLTLPTFMGERFSVLELRAGE
ncbi:SAM-dependent methyltransferase [Alicyclobacillus shizuokensis]|uniref:SAM-dependent methyltransferase n=1 Tax=Alicyclobacillus shizuokensis TaxID=392014 RepID=UPI000A90880C|nr:SAM-dependent methyltransferase [Alicyclobacillus shizuokensis]MCL6627389.1 SAM-dependent methyltransferase [Alicyclobacillus shizuokensis]